MRRNLINRAMALAALSVAAILCAMSSSGFAQGDDARSTQTLTEARELESPNDGKLRFNFRGVPLDTVLDYLAEAAGFSIIREASVQGRIDVVSHNGLNRDQAVDLLNTVLNKKGYAAIKNDHTLTIVTAEEAKKRDIPVRMGRDPEKVRKTDEMVTQVIPVSHANVTQLIRDIEPLLPSYAVMTANESSSAIVLTATQTDIHRIMEIIQALDTTMAEISTIRVFKLQHADATETAKMINDLFKAQATSAAPSNSGRRGGPPFMMMFGGGQGGDGNRGGGGAGTVPVTAVADTRTNSVAVSAPAEAIPVIEKLLAQVDTSSTVVTEIRVFGLRYADAQTMADMIENVFNTTQPTSSNTSQSSFPFVPRFMRGFGGNSQSQNPQSNGRNSQASVNAVADTRTNSIVVNADRELMEQIAQMVVQLDENPAKDRKVFVYSLKYADPEETARILEDMFGESGGNSGNRANRSNRNNRNNTRNGNGNNNNRRGSGGNAPSGMNLGL